MGRILFLSAVAFVAYKYISRSNAKHKPIASGTTTTEVLPPAPMSTLPTSATSAIESPTEPKRIATRSRAAESEPVR